MPLFFSLAVHNALIEGQAEFQPGKFLFAFGTHSKNLRFVGREIAF